MERFHYKDRIVALNQPRAINFERLHRKTFVVLGPETLVLFEVYSWMIQLLPLKGVHSISWLSNFKEIVYKY